MIAGPALRTASLNAGSRRPVLKRISRSSRQHGRQLHGELQDAAEQRAPRGRDDERVEVEPRAERDERADDRRVPEHRREVRQEELAMAVQDSERPRRQHEHARHREQDPHDGDQELAPLRPRSPA